MDREIQNEIEKAESSMFPPVEPGVKKKKPVKRYLSYLLIILSIVALVRLLIISGAPVEPVYEVQIPDSVSITSSVRIIEDYVKSEGFLPPGLQKRIESNPDISLVLNDDSSFTYIESGLVYRSAPGIILSGGEIHE